MEIVLKEKPKNPTIIEGFPGLGFVGAIATEYMIDHLPTRLIGYFKSDKFPPMAAIHDSKLRQLLEIFYCKNKNILFVHSLSPLPGIEWELADAVLDLANQLKSKQIISLEGVSSPFTQPNSRVFFHTNDVSAARELTKAGAERLKEGIIVGVTGALMLESEKSVKKSVFLFAETHTSLPDSRAAAELIKVLDNYLNLTIDYKPLLKKAQEVESKIKELIQKAAQTKQIKEKKDISYLG